MRRAASLVALFLSLNGWGYSCVTEVAALSRSEAQMGGACEVAGVVTMVAGWEGRAIVIADVSDPNGPSVYVTGDVGEGCRVGDLVKVVGVVAETAFVSGIRASSVRRIGEMKLPNAPVVGLPMLSRGALNLRRVRLTGVLQRVVVAAGDALGATTATTLRLGADGGFFDAHLPPTATDWTHCIDSELVVEGVVYSSYTRHGEFIGTQVEVAGEQDVLLLRAAGGDPFQRHLMPFARVLVPNAERADDAHARRLRGIVTYVSPDGHFIIQGEDGGIEVGPSPDSRRPRLGDEIDVVGFADASGGRGVLQVWQLRILSSGNSLPEAIGLEGLGLYTMVERPEVGFDGLSGCRVRIVGRLVGLTRGRKGHPDELFVSVPDGIVRAEVPGGIPEDVLAAAEFNPDLAVTGVARLSLGHGLQLGLIPRIELFELLVGDPQEVVQWPEGVWRSRLLRRRLVRGGLTAAGILVVIFLAKGFHDRRRRHQLEAVVAERKRMSADLHDTIEQSLAVANMVLNSSLLGSENVPVEVAEAVESVGELLLRTKRELRTIVWNLRNDELFERSPEEVLRSIVRDVAQGGVVRLRTKFRGLPRHLGGHILAEIVYVVKEAIANALKHGHATEVTLVTDPLPKGFVLTVGNNGEPFDPERASGVAEGHFGISGMRVRAKRSGFSLEFARRGAWTLVRLTVPC